MADMWQTYVGQTLKHPTMEVEYRHRTYNLNVGQTFHFFLLVFHAIIPDGIHPTIPGLQKMEGQGLDRRFEFLKECSYLLEWEKSNQVKVSDIKKSTENTNKK